MYPSSSLLATCSKQRSFITFLSHARGGAADQVSALRIEVNRLSVQNQKLSRDAADAGDQLERVLAERDATHAALADAEAAMADVSLQMEEVRADVAMQVCAGGWPVLGVWGGGGQGCCCLIAPCDTLMSPPFVSFSPPSLPGNTRNETRRTPLPNWSRSSIAPPLTVTLPPLPSRSAVCSRGKWRHTRSST